MPYTVLIPQDISAEGKDYLKERGYEIKMGSGITVEDVKRDVVGCDAVIIRTAPCPAEVLEAEPKLKIISKYGVGVDNVDVAVAERLGIWVTITAEANASTVAEAAIAFIMMLGRKLPQIERGFRQGNFAVRNQVPGLDLEGKVLGLVGLGKIGRATAKKALGLDMKVLAFDPYVSKEQVPEGVEMVDKWEDIFTRPDFVSLHMPFTGKPLIGMKEFSLMKPSAYFINVSRGIIVLEEELIQALEKGIIAGAALDVFVKEPPDYNNPLFAMDNVIVTPHCAGLTKEAHARMGLHAAMAVDEVLSGKTPKWPFNKPASPRNSK